VQFLALHGPILVHRARLAVCPREVVDALERCVPVAGAPAVILSCYPNGPVGS
jgi:hypothetical protein